MSGDLLELLFVAAFILFGLLGGRKKKRPPMPAQPPRQRRTPRAAADRTAVRSPAAARTPVPSPRGATGQDRLLRELEELLTGRPVPTAAEPAPAPGSMRDLPDPDEAQSLESLEAETPSTWDEAIERPVEMTDVWRAGRARAAETLETLEEAGGASHKRFHDRYDRQPEVVKPRPTRPAFPTADMRRAIIWSEILGPPVSER